MSSAVAALVRPIPIPKSDVLRRDPAAQAFLLVGVVEIAAGLVVLVSPRIGGLLVAGWLAGDIALRDFGLLLGALTLSRLASANFSDRNSPRVD